MRMLIVLSMLLAFGFTHCQKNEVTLYDQPNQQGDHITLSLSSDLVWKQFDKKASSVCVSGLMLFYTVRDFVGDVEYVYGEDSYCTNLKHDNRVSSVRYPGPLNDYKNDSITLYNSRDFQGPEKRVYSSTFDAVGTRSLIVTGGSSWTVFDDFNFNGNSVCLVAPNPAEKSPSFLVSASDIPDFEQTIWSGKKGCDDPNMNTFDLFPFTIHGP